jgi:hypothetical protein
MSEENKFIIQSLIAGILCSVATTVCYLHGGIKTTPPILVLASVMFFVGAIVLLINKLFKK